MLETQNNWCTLEEKIMTSKQATTASKELVHVSKKTLYLW
jgi:hypothetical protein